jgi:DNA-directed RNA polymerase specialized sigma24 family protein
MVVMMPDPSNEPVALSVVDGVVPAHDAVEQVWREQGPKLWRSLTAFTGDGDLAHDVMAEAFAQALGRGDNIRQPDRWIWRVSFLLARGELKQRRRRQMLDVADEPADEMPESVADIVSAMRTLSPNQRMAAILMLYADLSARDAGRVIGCTPATARVHLTNARRRLRPLLENTDV